MKKWFQEKEVSSVSELYALLKTTLIDDSSIGVHHDYIMDYISQGNGNLANAFIVSKDMVEYAEAVYSACEAINEVIENVELKQTGVIYLNILLSIALSTTGLSLEKDIYTKGITEFSTYYKNKDIDRLVKEDMKNFPEEDWLSSMYLISEVKRFSN